MKYLINNTELIDPEIEILTKTFVYDMQETELNILIGEQRFPLELKIEGIDETETNQGLLIKGLQLFKA